MAKKKGKWTSEEPEVAAAPAEPVVEEAPPAPTTLSLDEAKAIVNDAVQPRTPGHEGDPRPTLELLEAAKAVVTAAVQPKAPA